MRAAREAQERRLRDQRAVGPERHQPERDQNDGAVARCHSYILSGQPIPDHELPGVAVMVQDGEVLLAGIRGRLVLGPLHGAQAGIAGPVKTRGAGTAVAATAAFGVVGAVAALAARDGKPFAYVVSPDGTLHQSELKDKLVAARAQADVIRFNMLAAPGDFGVPGPPGITGPER